MDIIEQVTELRNIYEYGTTYERTKQAVNEAADTIEALSAKLKEVNMERSVDLVVGGLNVNLANFQIKK